MIRAIGDNIVELGFILLTAFLIWGIGFLIVKELNNADNQYNACIEAEMQWVRGNCVR